MLDQLHIELHTDLPGSLGSIAAACRAKDTDGRMMQAATECEALARDLKNAIIHLRVPAVDILCHAIDALRANGRNDLVERINTITTLIKGGQQRRIMGQALIGAAQLAHKIGAEDGIKILGMEHPETGEAVPIAKVK